MWNFFLKIEARGHYSNSSFSQFIVDLLKLDIPDLYSQDETVLSAQMGDLEGKIFRYFTTKKAPGLHLRTKIEEILVCGTGNYIKVLK